ncbi:MAG: NADH-ubiquinone oxidoreductase-F iron-sulfur binding region domain-containing protein, partial [Acidimicrobiales bacterium]
VAAADPLEPPAAALVGGFGGSWVRATQFSAPFDREGLRDLGATPGAGVVMVVGRDCCGLAEVWRVATAMAGESAGQCGPCVYGLPAVADDLALLVAGRGGHQTVARLTERLVMVTGRGACHHPDGVARMVATALTVFDADVAAHVAGHPCRVAARRSLVPLRAA